MYNKVIMIGRMVADPELIKTPKDKSVCRVSLAVNRRYKNADGEKQVDFINLVLWGKLAETLVSYASKGSLLSLDGELRTRKYEKEGHTTFVTEVLCQSFQLLESRAQRAMRENNLANDLADLLLEEDELPF
ncbi:single-stranded DNA-binding protein [Streptococcus didelphis]|nr:single-stranded DNA-binding protein [Streptococcus didelphis]